MAGSTATNNSHHTPDLVLVGIVGGGLLGIFCIMGLIAFCLRRLMPARDFLPDSAPQSPGSEGPNTRITISAPGPMDSSRFSAFSGRSSLDFASTSGSSRRLGFDCSKEDHLGSMRGVIEGIPELDYADLVKIKDKKLVDSDSCAVCLAEFEEHEFKIRVLPRCGHCFHSECIDLWLYSRTSCPLCRQSLLVPPTPAPPASDPSAIAANPSDVPERVDLPQTEPISTDQNPDR